MPESIEYLLLNPRLIGHIVGFKDLTEIHDLWIREIAFGDDDFTLQGHRGSYKSSCLAIAIALMMIFFKDRNIIFIRKADNDAAEMMEMVSKILRSWVFQDIANAIQGKTVQIVEESQGHITTNIWESPMGAHQLIGMGLKGSITGKHAHYVITDDICNISDRISRAERERTKLQYDELQNIKNRDGRIVNLGTPWHKEDVFTKMPNIHKYDCYSTGLISPEKLQALRMKMAPSLFAANYELKHIASSEALFTTAPTFFTNSEKLFDGVAHIDASYGGSDRTAFTCGRVGEDGKIYLFGKLWHCHVSKVLPLILAYAQTYRCLPIYVETNGDKGFLAKEIRDRDTWSKTYAETENKFIKISTYLQKWWSDIIFLEGTDRDYIDQILDYTEDAEHDDAPDSAACVCRILDRRATLYRQYAS